MRVDIDRYMEMPLTVANCIREKGSADVWKTTNVTGFWVREQTASTSGDEVGVTDAVKAQFAEEDMDGFTAPETYDGTGWTLRNGDILVNGTIEYEGDYAGLLDAIGDLECARIRRVRDRILRGQAHKLVGLTKWASIVYCEAR